jgi:hypothetical protein
MRLAWIADDGTQHEVCTDRDIVSWMHEDRIDWVRDLAFHTILGLGHARLEELHNGDNDPAIR